MKILKLHFNHIESRSKSVVICVLATIHSLMLTCSFFQSDFSINSSHIGVLAVNKQSNSIKKLDIAPSIRSDQTILCKCLLFHVKQLQKVCIQPHSRTPPRSMSFLQNTCYQHFMSMNVRTNSTKNLILKKKCILRYCTVDITEPTGICKRANEYLSSCQNVLVWLPRKGINCWRNSSSSKSVDGAFFSFFSR